MIVGDTEFPTTTTITTNKANGEMQKMSLKSWIKNYSKRDETKEIIRIKAAEY